VNACKLTVKQLLNIHSLIQLYLDLFPIRSHFKSAVNDQEISGRCSTGRCTLEIEVRTHLLIQACRYLSITMALASHRFIDTFVGELSHGP